MNSEVSMYVRVSNFVRLYSIGVLALLPFSAQANAPEPPRNIRVVPGMSSSCVSAIVTEADGAIKHLMEDYGLSKMEGIFLYSASLAGMDEFSPADRDTRENALGKFRASMGNMVSFTNDEFNTEVATMSDDTGLSKSEAEGIALIRLISRDETRSDELKAVLDELDAVVLELQATVRGCKKHT